MEKVPLARGRFSELETQAGLVQEVAEGGNAGAGAQITGGQA